MSFDAGIVAALMDWRLDLLCEGQGPNDAEPRLLERAIDEIASASADTKRLDWYDAHDLKPNILGGARVSIVPISDILQQTAIGAGLTIREAIDAAIKEDR